MSTIFNSKGGDTRQIRMFKALVKDKTGTVNLVEPGHLRQRIRVSSWMG